MLREKAGSQESRAGSLGEVWATFVEGMGRSQATVIQEALLGCAGTSRSLGDGSSITGGSGAGEVASESNKNQRWRPGGRK